MGVAGLGFMDHYLHLKLHDNKLIKVNQVRIAE